MASITMCPGTNCPLVDTCYRYTAKPSDYKYYFAEAPVNGDKCEMYWGINSQSVLDQLIEILK